MYRHSGIPREWRRQHAGKSPTAFRPDARRRRPPREQTSCQVCVDVVPVRYSLGLMPRSLLNAALRANGVENPTRLATAASVVPGSRSRSAARVRRDSCTSPYVPALSPHSPTTCGGSSAGLPVTSPTTPEPPPHRAPGAPDAENQRQPWTAPSPASRRGHPFLATETWSSSSRPASSRGSAAGV
jgi:hypothetical protein